MTAETCSATMGTGDTGAVGTEPLPAFAQAWMAQWRDAAVALAEQKRSELVPHAARFGSEWWTSALIRQGLAG